MVLLKEDKKRAPLIRILLTILSGGIIVGHLLTRDNYQWNRWLSEHMVHPAHRWLSVTASAVSFSVAEVIVGVFVIGLLLYLIVQLVLLVKKEKRMRRLLRMLLSLACIALTVYAAFCVLWGVYYYGDDFAAKSGLDNSPVSVEDLRIVTAYFAAKANEYAPLVPRDSDGVTQFDRQEILAKSPEVYKAIQEQYSCLEGPSIPVKGVHFSKIVSLIDFTGFFFPFTAEANVNMDFPTSLLPSTVAHELAHQRGVAKEQEANFCAVISSYSYGDPAYVYSASLLAFIHTGNALYKVDPDGYCEIYGTLSPSILSDFAANRAYWDRFDTKVREAYSTVYENFLYSFDQELGLRSYGACVDLLVHYYLEEARAFNASN